jgi:hypothetical protein
MAYDDVIAFLRTHLEPETFGLLRPGEVALRAAQFVTQPGDVPQMTRPAELRAMSPADRQLLFRRLAGRALFLPQDSVRREILACIRAAGAVDGIVPGLDAMLAERAACDALPAASLRLIEGFVAGCASPQVPALERVRSRRGTADGIGEIALLAYWLHCHEHPELPALLALAPQVRWPFIEDFALDTDRFPHEVEERLERFAAALER